MNSLPANRRRISWPGGDGLLFLRLSALILLTSGLFAVCLGVSGRFLPHDERFLGMSAADLCALHACRIVHFMTHDRVSFGGAVIAVGLLYGWLIEVPLRTGAAWAWWTLLLSGIAGFAGFFTYLGQGYLDRWHGLVTLALAVCFLLGLIGSSRRSGIGCLLRPGVRRPWWSTAGLGRACLLGTAVGLVAGGLTIAMVGMTCVFVPQDLAYLGVDAAELHALNPRLVPLIAHDRACFGGAVCSCGLAMFFCVWCGSPSRSLWTVLALAGLAGFGTAIGVHPAVGYNDAVHLAPAVAGALAWATGLVLTFHPMRKADRSFCRDGEQQSATSRGSALSAGHARPTLAAPAAQPVRPRGNWAR